MNRAIPLSRLVVRRPLFQTQQMNMSNVVSKYITGVIRRFMPKRTTIDNAHLLFHNCKERANNPYWYTRGMVPNDFRGKQIMLMVHVWMMHKRLLAGGREGQRVQEVLFGELWDDTSDRIRTYDVQEMSVNKHLKEVQGFSFRICVELDRALTITDAPLSMRLLTAQYGETLLSMVKNPDGTAKYGEEHILLPAQVEEVLVDLIAAVVYRCVYLSDDKLSTEHILEFAKYIRREQASLLTVSDEAIFDSRVEWGELPDFDSLRPSSGNSSDEASPPTLGDEGEWKEEVAMGGLRYYWHTKTRKTQWEKPEELLARDAGGDKSQI